MQEYDNEVLIPVIQALGSFYMKKEKLKTFNYLAYLSLAQPECLYFQIHFFYLVYQGGLLWSHLTV